MSTSARHIGIMPPRKPACVRIAEGKAGHRPIPTEVSYPTGIKCPSFLTPEARKEWRRIVSALQECDVLKATDTAVLASYCQNFARWKEAELTLAKEGTTIKVISREGETRYQRHPALSVSREAQNGMLKAGKQLGFTPVDRVRVPASPRQQVNPFGSLDDDDTAPPES